MSSALLLALGLVCSSQAETITFDGPGYTAGQRPPAPWAVPALGAALGLGFLTKGPVAVVLPGLGVLAYLWHRRRERWDTSSK